MRHKSATAWHANNPDSATGDLSAHNNANARAERGAASSALYLRPLLPPDPAAEGNEYREALARYRETARWVLTGLGAAAVAAIAGFGLSDFGKLSPSRQPLHFYVGCAGLVLAVGGFLGAISQALTLASDSWTEPKELTGPNSGDASVDSLRSTVNDPTNGLLLGFDSFDDLLADQEFAMKRWQQEEASWVRTADRGSLDLIQRWNRRAVLLASAINTAVLVASTKRLRDKFTSAGRHLLIFSAVAAAGIIAFAWAVTAPSAAQTSTDNNVHKQWHRTCDCSWHRPGEPGLPGPPGPHGLRGPPVGKGTAPTPPTNP